MSQKLLSTAQAAEYLAVTRVTAAAYAANGLVPAARIGNRWKFQQSDLDAFVASRLKRGR